MASFLQQTAFAARMFFVSKKNSLFKKKYKGSAEEICKQIIKDCWNGRYLQTSTGNFSQFWTRDFGWCTNSLLKLKCEHEVQQTLRYALNRFKEHRKITTTISSEGKPFDVPEAAVDSLPWLVHSIKIAKFPYHSYKDFLNAEIKKFYDSFIDGQSGLVRQELYVSSIKDLAVRKSSCYDNCLVALLAKDLEEMKLFNPLKKYDYPALIKQHFWNGAYFHDDLSRREYVAGDANLFPFILGIISSEEMLRSALNQIHFTGLDEPFPLKYTAGNKEAVFIWQEKVVQDYESHSIWPHMGLLYVKLLQQMDAERAKAYKEKYKELIEKHRNFLEVYDAQGKPFSSLFYYSDSGMLWAANYLTL
ncbi:MAG: hypothetical protein AB1668_01560 [Nanoarchaeota archaeon]